MPPQRWPSAPTIGFGTGFLGYCVLFNAVRRVGPRLSRACKQLPEPEQAEWSSCVVSSANATMMAVAMCRHVLLDRALRADRIYGVARGAEFWWGELLGYFSGDLVFFTLPFRKSMSLFWSMLFHHAMVLATYSAVIVQRRLAWYACAMAMVEITTPFGNYRWLMSKSDSPTFGRGSKLYTANGIVWLGAFFVARVLSIPVMLRYALADARMLLAPGSGAGGGGGALNSLTRLQLSSRRSDIATFAFLLGSYLVMVPVQLSWFVKMVKGALKLFAGADPEDA
eukprot:SAG22_NODE_252_length_13679_cov_74.486524_6_plen_282_part_00